MHALPWMRALLLPACSAACEPPPCPRVHAAPSPSSCPLRALQDWAGCLQALVAGAASISVSATQLCEPAANEARHCQVFAALVAPLLELQREQQAKPSAHWRFALPDAPAYSAEVLFHLLRCNDPAGVCVPPAGCGLPAASGGARLQAAGCRGVPCAVRGAMPGLLFDHPACLPFRTCSLRPDGGHASGGSRGGRWAAAGAAAAADRCV